MISDMPMDSHYEIGQLTKNIYIISLRIDKFKIFERKGISIKPGDKYKSAFELSYEVLKENRLFLSMCS